MSSNATHPSNTVLRITVGLSKPSALMFADSPEIIITRTPSDFALPSTSATTGVDEYSPENAVAAIAFGSNVGDRFVNVERALRSLEAHSEVKVLETGFLYESTAMYVEDQRDFVNGAALVGSPSRSGAGERERELTLLRSTVDFDDAQTTRPPRRPQESRSRGWTDPNVPERSKGSRPRPHLLQRAGLFVGRSR